MAYINQIVIEELMSIYEENLDYSDKEMINLFSIIIPNVPIKDLTECRLDIEKYIRNKQFQQYNNQK